MGDVTAMSFEFFRVRAVWFDSSSSSFSFCCRKIEKQAQPKQPAAAQSEWQDAGGTATQAAAGGGDGCGGTGTATPQTEQSFQQVERAEHEGGEQGGHRYGRVQRQSQRQRGGTSRWRHQWRGQRQRDCTAAVNATATSASSCS